MIHSEVNNQVRNKITVVNCKKQAGAELGQAQPMLGLEVEALSRSLELLSVITI